MGKFFRVALKTRVYDFQRSEGNILLLGWDLEKAVAKTEQLIFIFSFFRQTIIQMERILTNMLLVQKWENFFLRHILLPTILPLKEIFEAIWPKRWRGFGDQARRQPCRRTLAPSEWTATLYLSFPIFCKFLFKVQCRIDNESSSFFCISYLSVYYLWNFCFVSVLIQLMWDTQCLQQAFLPSLGPTSVTIAPPTKMVTDLSSDWKSQKMIQNGKLTWKNSQMITHKRLAIGTTFWLQMPLVNQGKCTWRNFLHLEYLLKNIEIQKDWS